MAKVLSKKKQHRRKTQCARCGMKAKTMWAPAVCRTCAQPVYGKVA